MPGQATTLIEHVVGTLCSGGVAVSLVVLAPHTSALGPLVQSAGGKVLELPQATPDMRASVERGLEWLEQQYHPAAEHSWLLVPADHGWIRQRVVGQLIRASAENPGRSIIVPTCGGRGGHPTLFKWKMVPTLRDHPPNEGINAFVRCHATVTLQVPVDDPGVLEDLDTPADYERLQRSRDKDLRDQQNARPGEPMDPR